VRELRQAAWTFMLSPSRGHHNLAMTFEDQAITLAQTGRYYSAKSVILALYRMGYGDARQRASWTLRRRIKQICLAALNKAT
jgi:hypothetical protein